MNSFLALSAVLAVASATSPVVYNGFYGGYSGVMPYSGYRAAPYAAVPYSYANTYHSQDELGQASYGHQQVDQAHNSMRDAYGNVVGAYSYISPEGKPITVRYTAGVNGFQVESNALPVAPVDTGVAPVETRTAPVETRTAPVFNAVGPAPVDFTPEVKAATAEHMKAMEEARSRNKRSLVLPLNYAGMHTRFAYSGLHAPMTYAGLHAPMTYAGLHAPLTYAGVPFTAATYSGEATHPAELTEVILNPGHATAYSVKPVV